MSHKRKRKTLAAADYSDSSDDSDYQESVKSAESEHKDKIIDLWMMKIPLHKRRKIRELAGEIYDNIIHMPTHSDVLISKMPFKEKCTTIEQLEILDRTDRYTDDFFQRKKEIIKKLEDYEKTKETNRELEEAELESASLTTTNPMPMKVRILHSDVSKKNKSVLLDKLKTFETLSINDDSHPKLLEWLEWGMKISDRVVPLKVSVADPSSRINEFLYNVKQYMDSKLCGMVKPKERLLELLALRIRNPNATNMSLALCGPPGVGKCLHPDTQILLYLGGMKAAKNISRGDILIGDDGEPRIVLTTTEGKDQMYSVLPEFGDGFIANSVHILTLIDDSTGDIVDIPINEYLQKSDAWKTKYKLFYKPVEYQKQTIKNDPYLVGLLLGSNKKSSDEIVKDYLSKKLDEITKCVQAGTSSDTLETIDKTEIGYLLNHRYIPDEYLYNTRAIRHRLLLGYCDASIAVINRLFEKASTGNAPMSNSTNGTKTVQSNKIGGAGQSNKPARSSQINSQITGSSQINSQITRAVKSSVADKPASTGRMNSDAYSKPNRQTGSQTDDQLNNNRTPKSFKSNKSAGSSRTSTPSRKSSSSRSFSNPPKKKKTAGSSILVNSDITNLTKRTENKGRSDKNKSLALLKNMDVKEHARSAELIEPTELTEYTELKELVLKFTSTILLEQMKFLIRSLGFECRQVNNQLYVIMLDLRTLPDMKIRNTTKFTIEPNESTNYSGFTLNGNGRFLLASCMVTHNTELIQTFCDATEQPFAKINMGGSVDPSHYLGHSYTYTGSTPGVLVRTLANLKTADGRRTKSGILFFDEFDKIGLHSHVGHVFLHISDPVQQKTFQDHYMPDISIDLSNLTFVYSLNDRKNIDAVLQNRLPIIDLPGYTAQEKKEIAMKYIIPKEMKNANLETKNIRFSEDAVDTIISVAAKEDKDGMRRISQFIHTTINKIGAVICSSGSQKIFSYSFEVTYPLTINSELLDKLDIFHSAANDTGYLSMYV